MGGGKGGSVTTGYWYSMGLHFGICHGPVDYLSEIRVGGRTAYNVTVTSSTEIYIDEPKLFGGKSREGGIQGYGDVLHGEATQGVNEYLQEKIGAEARVPAFRGLFAFLYKGGRVSANNPYIKPWAFKVGRIKAGWGELVEQEVTEIAPDYLAPWVADDDPRDLENGSFEYRWALGSWGTLSDAKTDYLADVSNANKTTANFNFLLGHSITPPKLWRVYEEDNTDKYVLNLHYNRQQPSDTDIGDGGYLGNTLDNDPGSGGRPAQQGTCGLAKLEGVTVSSGTFWWSGLDENGDVRANNAVFGIFQMYSGAATSDPDSDGGGDNCLNYQFVGGLLPYTEGVRDSVIGVRRLPTGPAIAGREFPDWPEDPANFTWDESTGTTYSKAPWVYTTGSFRTLATLVEDIGTNVVTQDPIGPIMEIGDPSDVQSSWEDAYDSAVVAGTIAAGKTYDPTGMGGVDTYPRNTDHAWTRTYLTLAPAEPPDPEYIQLGGDMNPAHIVRQCITNSEWGMGYPDSSIGTTFTTVAQSLFDEDFGLSFQWTQQEPIENFIAEVMNHCGGVWYADPRTGLFELALIRDDYVVSDLREFNETNIISVESYQRPGYGELVNQIVVSWTDVQNNRTATTAPLQDAACIAAQGNVIGEVKQYPGITRADLAQRVALRDLTAASTPLATLKLKVNREAWDLIPGKDVIVLSWEKLGIVQLVCRILKVDRGTLEDGAISIEVAEDVFGLPAAVYTTQEEGGWVDPDTSPDDITIQDLVESPYWDVARNLSTADLDYTDIDAGYVFTLAARSDTTDLGYDIWSRTGSSEYDERAQGPFAATALLNGALDQQSTSLTLDNGIDLDLIEVGGRLQIGTGRLAEFCEVLSFDATTGAMTVSRAVLDTTPQEHADNTRVWFVDDSFGVDPTERATSDEVDVKLTAIATGGESDLADATEQTITLDGRFGRPYPPGQIRINDDPFPTSVDTTADESEGLFITWAHRDRVQQDVEYVAQNETSIGPEAGTTYAVEIYNDDTDVLIDSASGIAGTSHDFSIADTFNARIEIYSVRDGIESWQRQIRRFFLIGADYFVTEDGDSFVSEDGDFFIPE